MPDTIYDGKKYVVPALLRQCNEYLKTVLKPDIACLLLLEEGRLIDDEEVIKMCWGGNLLGSIPKVRKSCGDIENVTFFPL